MKFLDSAGHASSSPASVTTGPLTDKASNKDGEILLRIEQNAQKMRGLYGTSKSLYQDQCQSIRKKTMTGLILHPFMWLFHTKAFLFGSSHAKKRAVKSPHSKSSVFVS